MYFQNSVLFNCIHDSYENDRTNSHKSETNFAENFLSYRSKVSIYMTRILRLIHNPF